MIVTRLFFGRNDAKAETPVLWPPHAKSWLIGKDPDAGRDWGQEEMGTIEDEMAEWHHQVDGPEFEWTPGVVMDREAWCAAIHEVAKSRTRLSEYTTTVGQRSVFYWHDHLAAFVCVCAFNGVGGCNWPYLSVNNSHKLYMIVIRLLAYWILRSLWWERQCYTTARPLTPYSISGRYLCYNSNWMLYFCTW